MLEVDEETDVFVSIHQLDPGLRVVGSDMEFADTGFEVYRVSARMLCNPTNVFKPIGLCITDESQH